RPAFLVGALPVVAINLLSDFPRVRTIEAHYTTAMVPFLLASAIQGAGAAQRLLHRGALPVAALLLCVTAAQVGHGGSPLAVRSARFSWANFRRGPRDEALRAARAAAPPGASV